MPANFQNCLHCGSGNIADQSYSFDGGNSSLHGLIRCLNCGCTAESCHGPEEAAKRWNKRADTIESKITIDNTDRQFAAQMPSECISCPITGVCNEEYKNDICQLMWRYLARHFCRA